MTMQELREKSVQDLHTLLETKRTELRELTFKAREMQLKEVHKISSTKKDIARILTVLKELTTKQAA